MKILIDCTSLSRNKTGIENYTEQLCISLIPLLKANGYEIVFLFSRNKPNWYKSCDADCVVYKGDSTLLLNVIWVPLQVFRVSPEITFFPAFPPSPLFYVLRAFKKTKLIRIVFDAVIWLYPKTVSLKNKVYYRPMETYGLSKYDGIATISESSLKDILQIFPFTKNKVVNIGTSLIRRDGLQTSGSVDDLIQRPFFLFVGTVDTRKNIKVALQAFAQFIKEFPEYNFVIAGRSAWGSKELHQMIVSLELNKSVILTGYVDDWQLNELYKKAKAFVFPSVYEGYGLPIVEAMSQGCPVIASNNSSIPEAAGEAALLIDKYMDAGSWSSAMRRIHLSESLRNDLIAKGYHRVQSMSWTYVGTKMLKLIDQVVGDMHGKV